MASKIFRQISGLRPGRSVFDLSYDKKFTCDMGQLIPIMCDELVPGDTFVISNEIVIRFQPLVHPILHEVNAYVHYFFVPYRLLWEDWENFITGGVDGDWGKNSDGEFNVEPPLWNPINYSVGSLWDYFGYPIDVKPNGRFPLDFPRIAYNFVYNEYYRDQNLQDEILLNNEFVLNRAWEKDYFTSALPWQQRGTAPAFPIHGTTSAQWDFPAAYPPVVTTQNETQNIYASGLANLNLRSTGDTPLTDAQLRVRLGSDILNNNQIDLSKLVTFDVADLRLAFQVQKWMERNARSGARYTEFLRSHFGVSPRDERLQRPEYIGGSKSPIIISEVLQTSGSDRQNEGTQATPQGNLAGHGITADRSYVSKYRATEFGLIIGLLSVMPRSAYSQGIDRQWLRRTRYDFYFPEFANLSEQAIEQVEIYADSSEVENKKIFGYQGRYDEMRFKRSMICGLMRTDFENWHLGRKFTNPPLLNEQFIECSPNELKRVFAVPSEPGLVVNFANFIKAIRPMPFASQPGLIDHN